MIRRPRTILALLTALNLLNYLDRLVVSAVLLRISEELKLDGAESGALMTVFLLGYFVTAPGFGALGDRRPRKGLIALGVAIWSLATFASGLATGALSLFAARAVVGVGEASYATLAPTIIDDIAEPQKKSRWLAIFYAATPIGAALGFLVGGFVEKRWGWRSAFYVAGGPGLLLSMVCLFIEEPARKMVRERAAVWKNIGVLAWLRLYRKGVLGYCAYTAAVGAFSHWAPSFLVRRYGESVITLEKANFYFGLVLVVTGFLGTAIGGAWGDRLQARLAPDDADGAVRCLLRVCATGSLIAAPFAVICFLAPSPQVFFAAVFVCEVALFLSTSPINGVMLRAVPPELRASAMALCIFAIHLFGDVWSPTAVGFLIDKLSLREAMLTLPVAIGLSGLIWWPKLRPKQPAVTT